MNVIIDHDTWATMLATRGLAANDATLLDELVDGDVPLDRRRCETSDGVQVHPHDVLRAALAGHVRRVVVDAASRPVDLGRSSRLFTGAAREAAKLLVRHCDHPGCELPTDWCDVDHATEWSDRGTTDQHNASIRCGPHNRAKHRHRWRSERAADGRTYTIRADGTIMLPVGTDPPTIPSSTCRRWRMLEVAYDDIGQVDLAELWR